MGVIWCVKASAPDTAERSCHGVQIYRVKDEDFQRPSILISESGRPALAAVVAAPNVPAIL